MCSIFSEEPATYAIRIDKLNEEKLGQDTPGQSSVQVSWSRSKSAGNKMKLFFRGDLLK
jgi:hypothetical protein